MKRIVYLPILFFFTCLISCSDDNPAYTPVPPDVEIQNIYSVTSVAQEDTVYLKAKINSTLESSFAWSVDGKIVQNAKDSIFKFVSTELGNHTITLSCSNVDGQTSANINVETYGKFKYGTFILNEGNMTTENGSLIFISPKGVITDSAYFKVNGTQLGNVTQDLFIANKKIYIISQNGSKNAMGNSFANDGILVVANAETLVKEISYNDELSVLSWPTHVAVLNEDNIFIRDSKGIYLFNASTRKLEFVERSNGANKNRMAVVNGKVFVPCKKTVLVLEANKTQVSSVIDMGATISGIIKSYDGNLWVSTTGPNKISKVSSKDYSIVKANEISEGSVAAGVAATPGISAKGDTLYFSGMTTKIYRHIFTSEKTEFMVDAKTMVENANMLYNTIAVHPLTGEVYMNTIKAYGWNFLINNISVFNFHGAEPKLSKNYTDHTHFPAGTFFTYDFE